MTINVTEGFKEPFDALAAAEDLFRDMAEQLTQTVFALRTGNSGDLVEARQAVKNLLTAVQIFNDERAKVEKLRKQTGGIVAGSVLDLGAARSEIELRLACIRDAGED